MLARAVVRTILTASSMAHQGHAAMYEEVPRLDPHSSSPYSHNSGSSHVSQPRGYTPPPISPVSPEEPTIKKKCKRADAAQLKVLNETYNRTAFPSTERRGTHCPKCTNLVTISDS